MSRRPTACVTWRFAEQGAFAVARHPAGGRRRKASDTVAERAPAPRAALARALRIPGAIPPRAERRAEAASTPQRALVTPPRLLAKCADFDEGVGGPLRQGRRRLAACLQRHPDVGKRRPFELRRGPAMQMQGGRLTGRIRFGFGESLISWSGRCNGPQSRMAPSDQRLGPTLTGFARRTLEARRSRASASLGRSKRLAHGAPGAHRRPCVTKA